MPFDNPSATVPDVAPNPVQNTLAAIGLHPVPREEAERYKKQVLVQFTSQNERRKMMVEYGMAAWRTIALAHPKYIDHCVDGAPSVPVEITDLAKSVRREIKGATFQVEYFDRDPILNVDYVDAAGHRHHDCLAIWDNGHVVAIASAVAIDSRPSVVRRLFSFFG